MRLCFTKVGKHEIKGNLEDTYQSVKVHGNVFVLGESIPNDINHFW
ncbi:hypothetical protein A5880_002345 [Enterococcus sp. 4G2_DIV0659]|uniref:Uncharacterized protein n=1 Tax=Candidatus Enterococcus mansonii TaxID=1834181 RepID=A0A242CHG8_9ENTE|nr:hypothetical protein A5880_000247 [Enterococcus sp. 4G2_DIV0659]